MQATLLLANAAEQPNGLLYAMGLGWSVTSAPTPPAALVVMLKVPWDQANQSHSFALRLVDADGHDFNIAPSPGAAAQALAIDGSFEVGRPPGIPRGTALDHNMTFTLVGGIPLTPASSYEWRLTVDGAEVAQCGFYVRPE